MLLLPEAPRWYLKDHRIEALGGTRAEDVLFPPAWDGKALAPGTPAATLGPRLWDPCELTEAQERDLLQNLSFMNAAAAPLAGKNVLDKLIRESDVALPLLDLLMALEVHTADAEVAKSHLDQYLTALRQATRQVAHPLLLLALHRVEDLDLVPVLQRFPSIASLLTRREKDAMLEESSDDPAEVWEGLRSQGCASAAMEELLSLTGLKKVKMAAVSLYRSALKFRRMPREVQKILPLNLNFCFLGNPGTGKKTVARLFASVLDDLGLRGKNVFRECTAEQLKEEGVEGFWRRARDALDGVFFIDEAYGLDPVGDKVKGAPLVDQLFYLVDSRRHTCVLAGHEDDMNSTIFAYNSALKHHFNEVLFEDFDETELAQIWARMHCQRGWSEGDLRLTDDVLRRMARGRGKRGFGNAREVRKYLEVFGPPEGTPAAATEALDLPAPAGEE
ncbi:spoVK [Symbiodinium natans]|uniref:SpoVK protein n=1 Tax=Symbiodinium natans TaxID=878477 RepID=A0A812MV04_9DINO|nr:spoVK [Symbiodinium natans]